MALLDVEVVNVVEGYKFNVMSSSVCYDCLNETWISRHPLNEMVASGTTKHIRKCPTLMLHLDTDLL